MAITNFLNFTTNAVPTTGDYLVGFVDDAGNRGQYEYKTTFQTLFDAYGTYASGLSGVTPDQLSTGHPSWNVGGDFTVPGQLNASSSIVGSSNISTTNGTIFSQGATNQLAAYDRNGSGAYASLYKVGGNNYLAGTTSGTVITYTSGGLVGIGTTDPNTTLTVKGTISASNIITTQNIVNGTPLCYRNELINGDMRINQRNAGAAATCALGYTYTSDRWVIGADGGAVTSQRINNSNLYSLRITGGVGNTAVSINQRVESANSAKLANQTVNLSFKALASVSTSVQWTIAYPTVQDNFTAFTAISSGTITATTSNIAFTTGPIVLPTNVSNGLVVRFVLTNHTAGKTFDLTNVQLEQGSVATPFEYRPIGTELALCQRYYEKSFDLETAPANGTATTLATVNGAYYGVSLNGNFGGAYTPFKVTKRAVPTITAYGNSSGYWGYSNTSTQTTLTYSASIGVGTSPGIGQGGFYSIQQVVNAAFVVIGGHWTANAEL